MSLLRFEPRNRLLATIYTQAHSNLFFLVSHCSLGWGKFHRSNIHRYTNKPRRKYNGINYEGIHLHGRPNYPVGGGQLGFRHHQLIGGLWQRCYLNNPEYAGSPGRVISRDSRKEALRDYQGASRKRWWYSPTLRGIGVRSL